MIPKIIHFCWFGKNAYPDIVRKCLESWQKYLCDYEIKIWNEESFDIEVTNWTKEAYNAKKWAFVSDYVRIYALLKYGGIYMDTDLEVIKDFSEVLLHAKFVSSFIEGGLITAGFIAAEANHPFLKEIISFYERKHFFNEKGMLDLQMNPYIYTKIAEKKYGLHVGEKRFDNGEIVIYPMDYFMPYRKNLFGNSFTTNHDKYIITESTYTIHHDNGSWCEKNKLKKNVKALLRIVLPSILYNYLKVLRNKKVLKNFKL